MKSLRDVARCQVLALRESMTVADAATQMVSMNCTCALVVDPLGQLSGILTDSDFALKVVATGKDPLATPVSEIMSRHPIVVNESSSLMVALERMLVGRFRHLPIATDDGSSIVGVLDITKCLTAAILRLGDNSHSLSLFSHIRKFIAGYPVSEVAEDASVCTLDAKTAVHTACERMSQSKLSAQLVLNSAGSLIGILTTKDVLLRVTAARMCPFSTTVDKYGLSRLV